MAMKTKAACVFLATGALGAAAMAPWSASADPTPAQLTITLTDDIVSGDWEGTLTIDTPQGSFDLDLAMTLELDDADVTGTFTITGPDGNSQDIDFEGEFSEDDSTISGSLTSPDDDSNASAELEIDGDDMTGTITASEGGQDLELSLVASRVE